MQKATLTDKDQAERVKDIERAIYALRDVRCCKHAKAVLECELVRVKAGFDLNAMSPTDVGDVLTSAFEGGMSLQWMGHQKVKVLGKWPKLPKDEKYASYVPGYGGEVEIIDNYDDGKKYVITGENMRRGIMLRAAEKGLTIREWIEQHDAIEADCALQLAVLGSIVYG